MNKDIFLSNSLGGKKEKFIPMDQKKVGTDEGQLGLSYKELEEAMDNESSKNREKYLKIRKANLHKMEPIPVCKIPN